MKKEVIDFVTGVFTDYKGLDHHITVVALSRPATDPDEYGSMYEVNLYTPDEGTDWYCNLTKTLTLGISVCNPEDKYNEKVGYNKALARARTSQPVMFVSKAGIINTEMVKALLNQELQFAINNPDTIIPGYSKTMQTYLKNKDYESAINNLGEDKSVYDWLLNASDEAKKAMNDLVKYTKNKQ